MGTYMCEKAFLRKLEGNQSSSPSLDAPVGRDFKGGMLFQCLKLRVHPLPSGNILTAGWTDLHLCTQCVHTFSNVPKYCLILNSAENSVYTNISIYAYHIACCNNLVDIFFYDFMKTIIQLI